MSKKGLGKFMAFAAVTGAVAAGVSYVLQYKTYHKELEKDFREFEDKEDKEEAAEVSEHTIDPRKVDRNYISLSSSRDEFKVAAKDMANATKNVLKDAGSLLSDTAHEAVSAAVDTAHIAISTMKAKRADFMEERAQDREDEDSEAFGDEGFLDEDYVDEDDLYDYKPTDSESDYSSRDYQDSEVPASGEEDEGAFSPKPTATIEDDALE